MDSLANNDDFKKHSMEMFDYDPDSGVFIYKKSDKRKKEGDVVGSLNGKGYLIVQINNKMYALHRLAFLYMEGEFPEHEVDHINRIKTDNRWENLRAVTHQENQRNLSIASNNTSGVTGVYWHDGANKWRAQIIINGKNKHLGLFNKLKEAKRARREAEEKYGFTCE